MTQCESHGTEEVRWREWLLDHPPGAEEFRNGQKVLIAGCAGHGNDSRVQEFSSQCQRDLHPIAFRHQDVSDHQISGALSLECEPSVTVCGLSDLMPVSFKDVTQDHSDRIVIIDNQDRSHAALPVTRWMHRQSRQTLLCG